MKRTQLIQLLVPVLISLTCCNQRIQAQGKTDIPFSCSPLQLKGDIPAAMVAGIDSFLLKQTARLQDNRRLNWHFNFSDSAGFNRSVSEQRDLLRKITGAVDERNPPRMEAFTGTSFQPLAVDAGGCTIQAVRWDVLDEMDAEGLLIRPRGKALARLILLPDADMLPEVLAGMAAIGSPGFGIGLTLANAGYEVLIPVLVSRQDTFSGNPALNRYTNQPHREWIYRQAYELGRHVIGYELQKIFAALDWMQMQNRKEGIISSLSVAGYGEGGLLALYATALDTRIQHTLVSGYFGAKEQLWQQPIYRNVYGLLHDFGDAELAIMSWPRQLIIENSAGPMIDGPPAARKGRDGAAPGALSGQDANHLQMEWQRALKYLPEKQSHLQLIDAGPGHTVFSLAALRALSNGMGAKLKPANLLLSYDRKKQWPDANERQQRTVGHMQRQVQQTILTAERARNKTFWQPLKGDTAEQKILKDKFREALHQQIGKLDLPLLPPNTRARLFKKTERWTGYEVVLDVWNGVFAYGILLVPNDIPAGSKRPVVVCQHGLEGVPSDVVSTDPLSRFYKFYKGFASQLADSGYITFAPANLYRGNDSFRVLQRKANPLGLSLFSIMAGQHQQIVKWLQSLPFADGRVGFYGLSYGGKTAMRLPAIITGYAFSICSGDFNEWITKCSSTDYAFSYLFTGEYDMQEWDLGHTFSYAEMAALIAPRSFMVERGHGDPVATDEWVGYEYEKVRRHYDQLQIPGSTAIEYFNGPHTIHGVGSFQFINHFFKEK